MTTVVGPDGKVTTDARQHQGLPVSGYRAQSADAVAQVNRNKELEERILRLLDGAAADPETDKRWLDLARTHIEQGFMALNRAVFKPGRVALPGDDPIEPADVPLQSPMTRS